MHLLQVIKFRGFFDCTYLDNSNLREIIIPDNVTTVGDYIFGDCNSLTSVTIGNNVKTIGINAFYGCENLTTLIWNAKNVSDFNKKSNIFYNAGTSGNGIKVTFGENVETIPAYLFSVNSSSYRPKIDSVTIGKNVISIGTEAFAYCNNLTSVIMADNVTSIGSYAFCNCSNLKSITLSDKITKINNGTFSACGALTNISIPDGVTSIGDYAFRGCSGLSGIMIPDSITSIGQYAFSGCSGLTSVTIPHSVTGIGSSAFSGCGSISVDENNKNYSSVDGSLFNKEKTQLMRCFLATENTHYTIPNSVTSIGSGAFSNCSNLTSVTISNSVTYIGYYAFGSCSDLTNVYYNGTKTDWNNITINENGNTPLTNAARTYFAYVKIFDKNGEKVIDTTQNMGEAVDTSYITVPNNCTLKLYKDKEMTEEYSLDLQISENLNLYYEIDGLNGLKITGVESADIGQKGITESVTFATDKTAKYLVANIKYSSNLSLSEIKSEVFDIEKDEYTEDGQTYLFLTCTNKTGGNIPVNTEIKAFDLTFDVSENATANDILNIEFVNDETLLADDNGNNYPFDGLGKSEIKVNPIFLSNITINGADEIDKATQYTAVISPENATNKEIEWSVDNSEIATISQDGMLTPVKTGTVKVKVTATATAKGENNVYGEKTVNVKVYATITSLSTNIGVWDKAFTPTEREYTIYVPKNTSIIKLTAKHSGTLTFSDKTFINNVAKTIPLTDTETVLTLTYSQTDYTDSTYTIKIVKFEGTQTSVSADGKTFTVKPINIDNGSAVILALYNGDTLVEMQSATSAKDDVPFTTDKAYTSAKVMVWKSLSDMTPLCKFETVK